MAGFAFWFCKVGDSSGRLRMQGDGTEPRLGDLQILLRRQKSKPQSVGNHNFKYDMTLPSRMISAATLHFGKDVSVLESRYIEFGPGRQIHALIGGEGPAIVIFPGNGGSVADFGPVMQQLATDYRVVGLDLPGRSETQWSDSRFDFAADLQPVIDWSLSQLGVGMHVAVGHGSGALVALHHAQRHFGQVQGVSMVEGYVNFDAQTKTVARRYRQPIRVEEQLLADFQARRRKHAAWLNAHSTFRESFNTTQRTYDASDWIGELDIPIHVIVGDQGQTLPHLDDDVGWHRQLNLSKINELYITLIKDAGYWIMLDDPDAVTGALRDFAGKAIQTSA